MQAQRSEDRFEGDIPIRVPAALLKELSAVNGWMTSATIAFQWILIVGAVYLSSRHFHPLAYIVSVAWIGARQHALGVLMHDASHVRLYRNKSVNDWVSDLFCAWPLLYSVDTFRKTHWPHHRKPNTTEDPIWMERQFKDWEFPKTWPEIAWLLFRDVTGINFVFQLIRMRKASAAERARGVVIKHRPGYRVASFAYFLAMFGAITYFGLWSTYLLYWIVPLFTWVQVILRLRAVAEHYGVASTHSLNLSRTTVANVFDRLFVAPLNVGFHIEHHLFPSVPLRNLGILHRELMKQADFNGNAHVTHGYFNVLRECVAHRRA